jgi:hypothetical protein
MATDEQLKRSYPKILPVEVSDYDSIDRALTRIAAELQSIKEELSKLPRKSG